MDTIYISEKDEDYLLNIKKSLAKKKGNFSVKISMADSFKVYIERYKIHAEFSNADTDDNIRVKIYTFSGKNESFIASFTLNHNLNKSEYQYPDGALFHQEVIKYAQDASEDVMMITILFFYVMNNYSDYSAIEESVKTIETAAVSKNKNKKSSTRIVKVLKKTIRLSNVDEVRSKVEKSIQRQWHVDGFGRRGHWRVSKNGVRTWIKATKVKTGASTGIEKEKTYRL